MDPVKASTTESWFIFFLLTIAGPALGYIPIASLFGSKHHCHAWLKAFGGWMPWLGCMHGAWIFAIDVGFVVASTFSVWLLRTHDEFSTVRAAMILYYIAMAMLAVWSWSAMLMVHVVPCIMLWAAVAVYLGYVIAAWIQGYWVAGLLGLIALLIQLALPVLWCWLCEPPKWIAEMVGWVTAPVRNMGSACRLSQAGYCSVHKSYCGKQ